MQDSRWGLMRVEQRWENHLPCPAGQNDQFLIERNILKVFRNLNMIKRLLYGTWVWWLFCSRKPENLDTYLSQHLHPQVEIRRFEMEKLSALMDMHFFTNALQEMEAFCSTLQLQKLKNVPSRSLGQKDKQRENLNKTRYPGQQQ